ncbi:Uncharacterised protein [Bordetella pertussis]|nr:Uncharacterised protein [Bordetella pertussis]
MRHQAFDGGAAVREHIGQPRAGQGVQDEHGAQHGHGQAQRAAGDFQQQQQAGHGGGHVHGGGLARRGLRS